MTSSREGTTVGAPSRSTVEVASAIDCSAATAVSARACCRYPRIALTSRTAEITTASTGIPATPSVIHAASEIATATINR